MAETPLVRSLLRGLEILELAADSAEGATLAAMAECLGVGRPTAFNLARTLVAKGYLEKSKQPVRYRPGRALGELLARRRRSALHAALRVAIRELAASFRGVWVFAAEPSAGETLITLRLDPARPEVVEEPLHRVSPAYHTAAALAVCAFGGDDERQAIEARHPFDETGLSRWESIELFENFLSESRDQGFVAMAEPQCRLVFPVRDREGELRAVLGLSFGNERQPTDDEKQQAIEALSDAIDQIEMVEKEMMV